VEEAIKDPKSLIEKALKLEKPTNYVEKVQEIHQERAAQRTGAYKHLMTGVSYMIPFVVAGGILIALSFFWGYKAFQVEGTLPWALMKIGGGSAFALMIPILSGFIAFSIADRPGLVPGMVGGMLAASTGAGFLGGIISGFLAGYTVVYLKKLIKLPKNFEGLMPILILPVLSTLIVGLLMIYVIGSPLKNIMTALTNWLTRMSSTNAVILGVILGLMMAFDMGGPVNKAAYTFATGLLASNVFTPMAAVMAAGMTPPLGLALATVLFKNRFTDEEIEAGKAAWVLGASFITEGAIPFAAADPFRVIPSIMVGSAVTAALSMLFRIELRAPHGGIFVIPIAVSNPLLYIGVIAIGTVVTALMVALLKKRVA
jgi:PTS system fructose-specific IIC component